MTKVVIIVGSFRHESYSRKVAKNVTELFPEGYEAEFISIGTLPLYNQALDEDHDVPDPWVTFREKVKACDAVLFVTPEYNRSVPGVLKNAIDIGSRPRSEEHTSELQSRGHLVCRLLLEKKKQFDLRSNVKVDT